MQLSFYARPGYLVPASAISGSNQIRKFVGYTFKNRQYIALEKPFTVEANSSLGRALKRAVRREKSLWPADRETAQACGITFTNISFVDGEWKPSDPSPPNESQHQPEPEKQPRRKRGKNSLTDFNKGD